MSLIIFPKKFGSISSCKKYKNSGYCQFLYGKKYLYEIYYEKWPFFKNLAGATSKRHFWKLPSYKSLFLTPLAIICRVSPQAFWPCAILGQPITYTYLIIYWEREGPSGHPIETIWTGAWNCLLLVVNISWIEGGLFDPIYWEYSVNRGLDFAVVRENFLLEGDSFPLTRVSRKCLCLRVRTTLFGPSYRRMTDH